MRAFTLAVHSHSSDSIKKMMTDLQTQMGTVVETDVLKAVRTSRDELLKLNDLGDLTVNVYTR